MLRLTLMISSEIAIHGGIRIILPHYYFRTVVGVVPEKFTTPNDSWIGYIFFGCIVLH